MQVIAQGPAGQGSGLRGLGGKDLLSGAVSHVDGVYIVNELHHMPGLHKVGEPPAELGGEVELSVGERARPAEAAHGVTHGAVDALPHFARHNGAAAVVDVPPLVQGQHLQLRAVAGQLIGGENPSLTTAQDDNVIDRIHGSLSLYFSKWIRPAAGQSLKTVYHSFSKTGIGFGAKPGILREKQQKNRKQTQVWGCLRRRDEMGRGDQLFSSKEAPQPRQVTVILPLPRGTRSCWPQLGHLK